jgi:hypothetical protein
MSVKTAFISEEVSISRQSIYIVIDKKLQNIDKAPQGTLFGKLGFGDTIVEVDETHICTRRDGRGEY